MPEGTLLHSLFLAVYLVALLAVGASKARGIRNQADFSLAGRGLSTPVLVGTLLATWIGTGSLFGNAGEAYRVGLDALLLPLGSAFGMLLLLFLAARIRRFGQFTLQDVLEARFGVTARVLGTVTLVIAYVIIVSYQYRAGAAVLGYLWPGLSSNHATCLVAAFVILYTALAGMYSVAYTDVANGVLMILGIGLALALLWGKAGGLGGALASLPEDNRSFFGNYDAIKLLGVTLPAFLLIVGDANMVQRFFSARTPTAARRSVVYMLVGVTLLELAILLVAILASGLVARGELGVPGNDGHILIHLAFEGLPTWLGALLVATAMAVVVSTADSYLLSPSTSLVRDVYQRFLRPGASEHELVRAGRIIVVVIGLVALSLSFISERFFSVALFAYTIYGAGLTPALFAAYFWKRATSKGAIGSILSGVSVAVAWRYVTGDAFRAGPTQGWLRSLSDWGHDLSIDPVLPSFLVSVLVLVVISLVDRPPTRERADALDASR